MEHGRLLNSQTKRARSFHYGTAVPPAALSPMGRSGDGCPARIFQTNSPASSRAAPESAAVTWKLHESGWGDAPICTRGAIARIRRGRLAGAGADSREPPVALRRGAGPARRDPDSPPVGAGTGW